jgi:hypothetical protein
MTSTKTRKLCFSASKIAALIGQNPYEKPDQILFALIEENNPELVSTLAQQHGYQNPFRSFLSGMISTVQQYYVTHASQWTLEMIGRFLHHALQWNDTHYHCPTTTDMDAWCQDMTTEDCKSILLPRKTVMQACLRKTLYCSKGQRNEQRALDQVEHEQHVQITDRNQHVWKRDYGSFIVSGRVDGMDRSRSTVYEMKVRQHGLFKEAPMYEKIQAYVYLTLTKCPRACLVQTYEQEQQSWTFTLPSPRWFETECQPLLEQCVQRYQQALTDSSLLLRWIREAYVPIVWYDAFRRSVKIHLSPHALSVLHGCMGTA